MNNNQCFIVGFLLLKTFLEMTERVFSKDILVRRRAVLFKNDLRNYSARANWNCVFQEGVLLIELSNERKCTVLKKLT